MQEEKKAAELLFSKCSFDLKKAQMMAWADIWQSTILISAESLLRAIKKAVCFWGLLVFLMILLGANLSAGEGN